MRSTLNNPGGEGHGSPSQPRIEKRSSVPAVMEFVSIGLGKTNRPASPFCKRAREIVVKAVQLGILENFDGTLFRAVDFLPFIS